MQAPNYSTRPCEIFSSAVIEDPQTLYATLRRERPISRVADTGVHLVANWELLDEALQRPEDFSANLTGVLAQGRDGEPTIFSFPETGATGVIATADEPDHAVHRSLCQPRLAPRRIAAMEPQIRAWSEAALAPWIAAGGGDFMPIAEEVPARAVAHLLGLPEADVLRHRKWAMMGGDLLAGVVDTETLGALASETRQMSAYLQAHLAEARPEPAADPAAPLLVAFAGAVARGEISAGSAVGISIVLFGAAGESTAALFGSAMRRLASDPPLAQQLRDTPSLLPRFIEEVVRLEPPFNFHYRAVRRACELGGVELALGDRLMLVWASANRDPAQFEAPDELRLDRRHPNHHMGFGRGGHFCIGSPLARLEARVLLQETLAGTREIRIPASQPPEYTQSIFVRRLERLMVDVERA